MKLPKRVPWASLRELEQLCSWIYNDEYDIEAKILAINRMSAWKAITTPPHAIESALSLLVVIVQDEQKAHNSFLSLRQSYATAILRLINGLVDPLQIGTYARPIASIAKQLGIPPWLVELRHAATHEDLPSLDLLREAARQSMAWLLHNYFLPTLNPPNTDEPIDNSSLRPISPLLQDYKATMKIITKDASLVSRHKPKITALFRDIERWISESKVLANVSIGEIGWTSSSRVDSDSKDADAKEVWALEIFCDGLAERGVLVPLSKKKRQTTGGQKLPHKTSLAIWNSLLQHVWSIHPAFPSVFCRRLASKLFSTQSTTEDVQQSPSYNAYLSYWILWAIETWKSPLSRDLDLQRETALTLLLNIQFESAESSKAALSLLRDILSQFPELDNLVDPLLEQSSKTNTEWNPDSDLTVMAERLAVVRSSTARPKDTTLTTTITESSTERPPTLIPGWTKVRENVDWKPCPIGVYYVSNH